MLKCRESERYFDAQVLLNIQFHNGNDWVFADERECDKLIAMRIEWLRFSSAVEISSGRSVADCTEALRYLIAEPANLERYKAFLGFVTERGGEVRRRVHMFGDLPGRVLKFNLTPSAKGCFLIGKLELRKLIRIPVGIYLILCLCAEVWGIFEFLFHRSDFVIDLAGPIISFLMIYGWTYLVVRLNRKPDEQMVRALKHVMADEQSAAVVVDLLSSSR